VLDFERLYSPQRSPKASFRQLPRLPGLWSVSVLTYPRTCFFIAAPRQVANAHSRPAQLRHQLCYPSVCAGCPASLRYLKHVQKGLAADTLLASNSILPLTRCSGAATDQLALRVRLWPLLSFPSSDIFYLPKGSAAIVQIHAARRCLLGGSQ